MSLPSAQRAAARLPLLLLPGTLCDARLFAPLIAGLDGWPVLVAEMTGARTTPDLARRLLADAPEKFALLGFSLGGIVALEMVAEAPERVARLALVDTTARPDPPENAVSRRHAAEAARRDGTDGFINEAWEQLVAPVNGGREDIRETLLAMARDGGAALLDDQSEVAIHRADGRPRLARIGVPTLVLAGAHERVCPVEAHREIAEEIPGAEFHLIPGAGHFAPLENPDAVAHHVRQWLRAAQNPALLHQKIEETA